MTDDGCLCDFFTQAGIEAGMKIGVAGWKLFTSQAEENSTLFDVPSFIVELWRQAGGRLINATGCLSIRVTARGSPTTPTN